MEAPKLSRFGESYEYIWQEIGIGIGFSSVRERSGELHAEIWASTDKPTPGGNQHIVWGSYNLSSITTRTKMAKELRLRAQRGTDTQWESMLEYACLETARLVREGEPCYDLSEGQPILEVEWLCWPILARNVVTSFFADGDSGKGWLALGVALGLVLGGEVIPGIKPRGQCKCLYLDWETDYSENSRRLEMLCRGLDIHVRPDGIKYRRMTRALADDLSAIRAIVDKEKIGLVVIDSAGPATGAELKESEPVVRFMAALRQIEATKMILGHVTKATAENRSNERGRMFGSIFFENLSRACWEIRSDTETNPSTIGFFHRKANMGPKQEPFAFTLKFDDINHSARFGRGSIEDSPTVAAHASVSTRMISALRAGQKSTKDLAEELGTDVATMRVTLNRAAFKGDIVQVSEGGGRGKESAWKLALN